MNKFIEAEISLSEIKKISKKNQKLKDYIKTFCLFRTFFIVKDGEKSFFYSNEIFKMEESIKKDKDIFEDILKARNILIKTEEKDLKKILFFLEEN